ncbi:YIP1 family protein [Psychrobacillus sp. L3]|uniref:YIP1 family protein n=1 Tax=Psychrobacillus sp. L3 TaxID=3236891 RepID=UPI0036F2BF76
MSEMRYEGTEKLNPFFSIWLSTRKTVRYVLEHKSLKYSLTLAAIAGVPGAINSTNELSKYFSDLSLWFWLLCIILLGPIFGLISVGIGAVIYTWVGKWFGGSGTIREMAQMMGVTVIPSIWLTPYWILSFIFVHNNLFIMNFWEVTSGAMIWFILSNLFTLTYSIWMIIIQSKAIGEVHQFSSGKGFATLIIPGIVLGIILFIITFFIITMTTF